GGGRQRGRADEHGALLGGVGIRHGRRPTVACQGDHRWLIAAREVVIRAEVGRVRGVVGEIVLFGGDEIAQVRLHGRDQGPLFGVYELGNGDRGDETDNR